MCLAKTSLLSFDKLLMLMNIFCTHNENFSVCVYEWGGEENLSKSKIVFS